MHMTLHSNSLIVALLLHMSQHAKHYWAGNFIHLTCFFF